jgi:hypothetical protein
MRLTNPCAGLIVVDEFRARYGGAAGANQESAILHRYSTTEREGRPMSGAWTAGNATEDAAGTRGWLAGHFIDPSQRVRASKDVEVKWANHHAGDKRPEWTSDDQRTTLVMLISGEFRVEVTGGNEVMNKRGDYVMWGRGSTAPGRRRPIRSS